MKKWREMGFILLNRSSNPVVVRSNFGQVRSPHIASVYLAVRRNTWRQNVADFFVRVTFAYELQLGLMFPKEVEMVFD